MEFNKLIVEHVFEIRHEASGKFLDVKGCLADSVKKADIFNDWAIESSLIRFYNANNNSITGIEAFVSHNTIRFFSYMPETNNYFKDKLLKFIKTLEPEKSYSIPVINRLGIRTRCFIPLNAEFKNIFNKIYSLFYKDNSFDLLELKSDDLQVVLQGEEQDFKVKISFGAVKRNESANYFNFKSDKFVNAGIYIDIDCFQLKRIEIKDIIKSSVDKALKISWRKIELILDKIGIPYA